MNKDIKNVSSWGKYLYRAELESQELQERINNDTSGIRYFIFMSKWLASLYVVVEGWEELKFNDPRINTLINEYSDYVLIIKRCRNAVYHFQKDTLDNRIKKATQNSDLYIWAQALQFEFVRVLFTFSYCMFGVSEDSVEIQETIVELSGWDLENSEFTNNFELFVSKYDEFIKLINEKKSSSRKEEKKINEERKKFLKLSNKINPYMNVLTRI